MDYRDERDALRSRVENLEQDLAGAREELADGRDGEERQRRITELTAHMAEARRLLDQLGGELAELREKPGPRKSPPLAGPTKLLLVGVGVIAVAGGAFFLHRSHVPAPPHPPASPPISSIQAPPPLAPTSIVPLPPTPPPPAPVRAVAHWQAKVTHATGKSLAPGSTCVVEATLEGRNNAIHIPAFTVTCGGARLYDSQAKLEGMSMSNSGAEEEAGDREGTFRYALEYEDKGPRSGERNEISLNTLTMKGSVWSDSTPAFRVELSLPYQSDLVEGTALVQASTAALRRDATVTGVSGAAPLRVGTRCKLRVTPRPTGRECQTRLVCGSTIVYGKGTMGVASCTMTDGALTRITDSNPTSNGGDPEIAVDVSAGTMELADEIGGSRWSVTFGLDP